MPTTVTTAFVISPFGEPFDTYFVHVIKPALEDAGLYAVRGDSLYRPTTIVDDIWQGIQNAQLLIAELTGRNPNVFYELGLAHALSKPVILLSESIEDVPFDLRSIRILLYDKNHPDWGSKLRAGLTRAIGEVLANPTTAIPTTFKLAVKTAMPEESETLLRLEVLEATVYRLADELGQNLDTTFYAKDDPRVIDDEPPLSLSQGQKVFHAKFGQGEVLSVEAEGKDARAQINFVKAGVKWLALSVAKLQIVGD